MLGKQEVRNVEHQNIFMGSHARSPIGVYAEQDGMLFQMGVRRWSIDLAEEGLLRDARISWKQARGPELDIPHFLTTNEVRLIDDGPQRDDRIWNEVTKDIQEMRGPITARVYLIKRGEVNGTK